MKKIHFMSMALSAVLLWGCYPAGPEYYEDLDVVATRFEGDFDFTATSKTYTLPPKIVKITGNVVAGDEPEYVSDAVAAQIFDRIRANMTSYGWTYTDNHDATDVAIIPAVWQNTTVYYWYDYWCWWYYYYCGWGWGYPVTTSYTTGTLVMAMTSFDDQLEEPQRVWIGAINGLLSGAYDVSRVNNGIDQAFEQSPYLKVN